MRTIETIHRSLPNRIARITIRFLIGRDLDGHHRTSASWWHRGEKDFTYHGHASRWAHQSHARRSGIRITSFVFFCLLLYGFSTNPSSTIATMRILILITMSFFIWLAIHKTRRWGHHQQYVVPTALVLGERLGISRHIEHTSWVHVPIGHRDNPDKPATIDLPAMYRETDRQQEALAKLAAKKLHVNSFDWELNMEGEHPLLTIRAQLVPPDVVTFAMAEKELEKSTDGNLFLGYGIYSSPIWMSWALDSPSLALSFGSGAGKSTVIRNLAAQTLHQGGRVAIFDIAKEGESHGEWCRDEHGNLLPGIEMYRDVETGHQALVQWAAERKRRSAASWNRTGEDFQRTLIVLEELNATMPELKAYWTRVRSPGQPRNSPAIEGIRILVNTGRSTKINCVAAAQRFDSAAIGGGAVRESFQIRALARFSQQTTKMLIPEIVPPPKSSNHLGRMVVACEGEVQLTQGVFMTNEEAIEWSLSGEVSPTTDQAWFGEPQDVSSSQVTDTYTVEPLETDILDVEIVETIEVLISIKEACETGIIPNMTEAAVKQSRSRHYDFPEPQATQDKKFMYRPEDLENWWVKHYGDKRPRN